jgi:deoxycytidine triphosphate deaminase
MPDHWIRRMATERGMIEPFVEGQRRDGVISYGLSSFGYDARAPTSSRSSPTWTTTWWTQRNFSESAS